MIVFDLECRAGGHRFEGWFGSSEDFLNQQGRGLIACPECGSSDVIKAPMAPRVGRKGNQQSAVPAASTPQEIPEKLPPEAVKVMKALAAMQAEALKESRWVGGTFVEESRAMHYGEKDMETIHGEATMEEAKALVEEGIEIAPLLFPVAPPGKTN